MAPSKLLFSGLLLFAVAALLFLATMPMDSMAQVTSAAVLLAVMWYCRVAAEHHRSGIFRIATLSLGVFISIRYLLWRAEYTLTSDSAAGLAATLLLYAAELYYGVINVLGSVVNIAPLRRELLSLADVPAGAALPFVDVLIPSYNEDADLLKVTVQASLCLDYPPHLLRVHLCDDGGTDQKIADADPAKARLARDRRANLQAMCAQLGANYITRARNEHAKAGNLNHAMQQTAGDLIVILDADHVPTIDFLQRTVPWFVLHRDVFLVQTPHFMVNPDPIERNLLQSFRRMPSENDMFYQTIQRGLDFWSSSFFCGSAAVLRRAHLDEVGGLAGETITEDAETALALHARGYRSIYVNHPMVAGLAPETFTGFVIQRMRWAQGMTQILVLKRPWAMPGLTWYQRVGYMSSILFWLFPFARSIFLVAPLAYLLFGLEVYNASIGQIIAFMLPHVIATYIVNNTLYGRTRWPLISELYEIMQCLFSLRAVIQVLINPRAPAFMVTPKGDTLEQEFLSPLCRPFYTLFFLTGLGFIGGAYRWHAYPLTRELTVVVLLWNLFNCFIAFSAFGALLERRQVRAAPRMPIQETGVITLANQRGISCELDDLSASGARILIAAGQPRPAVGDSLELKVYCHPLARTIKLPCAVRAVFPVGRQSGVGLQFLRPTDAAYRDAVMLAYGDSERWSFFQNRRLRALPFGAALSFILGLVWRPVLLHFRLLVTLFWQGAMGRRLSGMMLPAVPKTSEP